MPYIESFMELYSFSDQIQENPNCQNLDSAAGITINSAQHINDWHQIHMHAHTMDNYVYM